MLNLTVHTGRLTRDPELRYTKNEQTPVTSFSIAVKRDYIREGEPDTDFFDVVAWRGTAEFICKYFTKGSLITVVGNLQNRKWTDQHSQTRTATEIIANKAHFGESKGANNDNSNDILGDIDPYDALPVENGTAEQEPIPPVDLDAPIPPPNFTPFD